MYSYQVTALTVIASDKSPSDSKCQYTAENLGQGIWWSIDEKANEHSLSVARVLGGFPQEVLKTSPLSVHYWLHNLLEANRGGLLKAVDAGLKQMQGLIGNDRERFPCVMGTVKLAASVPLPKPFLGPDLSDIFLRLCEVGIL